MEPLPLLELLGLLILPGLALSQVLGLRAASLVDGIALAFGLGTSFSVLVIIAAASGFDVGGIILRGISSTTIGAVLAVSALALAVGVALRRGLTFYSRPRRVDCIVAALLAVQALLVGLHFFEYPVFPQFSSVDFTQHVLITHDLQAGTINSLPGGLLYYGAHAVMGALLALSPDPTLVVTQWAMGVLVVLSPLLVFSAVKGLTESDTVSVFATLVYVAGGFIWFGSVFDSGLYSNFYGLLSTLFLLVAAAAALSQPTRVSSWVIYVIAVANAFVSHYSTLTIIPALLLAPGLEYIFTRKLSKPLLAIAALPVIPVVAVVAVSPAMAHTLLNFVTSSGGGNITGDTALSSSFAWFPFLRYVFVEITSDSATLVILLMAVLGGYFTLKQRRSFTWVPLVWLVSVAVAAPFSEAAWRFSYAALAPLVIVAALGLNFVLRRQSTPSAVRRKRLNPRIQRRNRMILVAVVLALMVAGSWGTTVAANAVANGQVGGQAQVDVYNSMTWFASNTPPDSRLVSITDSQFQYMWLLTGRTSGYAPLTAPADLLTQLVGQKDIYVALAKVAALNVSGTDVNQLFDSYATNPTFRLAYNNSDVTIYSINASA